MQNANALGASSVNLIPAKAQIIQNRAFRAERDSFEFSGKRAFAGMQTDGRTTIQLNAPIIMQIRE